MTPASSQAGPLASIVISTETAAALLAARAEGKTTVTLSAEEVETIAARLSELAIIGREYHDVLIERARARGLLR